MVLFKELACTWTPSTCCFAFRIWSSLYLSRPMETYSTWTEVVHQLEFIVLTYCRYDDRKYILHSIDELFPCLTEWWFSKPITDNKNTIGGKYLFINVEQIGKDSVTNRMKKCIRCTKQWQLNWLARVLISMIFSFRPNKCIIIIT